MITQFAHLNPEHQSQVLSLIASATDHDGVPPVSEHVLLHLRHGGDKADTHFIATQENIVAGLRHMRYQGIFSAMLYVDADNHGAINLYQSLGFTEWGRDVLYRYTMAR